MCGKGTYVRVLLEDIGRALGVPATMAAVSYTHLDVYKRQGQHLQVYVVDVRETERGPRMMISRTHPGLVKRMFEMEVPEIYDGTVEIKAISREAGARTKMAVWSKDENVDPVGACIGPRGARVAKIVDELGGEKIDIVRWSEDPAAFISEALSPAKVVDCLLYTSRCV